MSKTRKYKIYSKSHVRRLARLEANVSYSHSKRLLQTRQRSPCSSVSSRNECNEEISAQTRNVDNNIAYISPNQDNQGDGTSQSNSIECDCDVPSPDVLEFVEVISTNNDNFYCETNNKSTDENFKETVAAWAIKFGITHSALTALLEILNIFTNTTFPKNSRTLLQTPRKTDIIKMDDGQYCHFDIVDIVKKMIIERRKNNMNITILDLIINIDGMSISRSSNGCFWPILVSENLCDKVKIYIYMCI